MSWLSWATSPFFSSFPAGFSHRHPALPLCSPALTFGLCKTQREKKRWEQSSLCRGCSQGCSAGFQQASVGRAALCSQGTTQIQLKPGWWPGEVLHHEVLQKGLEASPCPAHGSLPGICVIQALSRLGRAVCCSGLMAAADAAEVVWKIVNSANTK